MHQNLSEISDQKLGRLFHPKGWRSRTVADLKGSASNSNGGSQDSPAWKITRNYDIPKKKSDMILAWFFKRWVVSDFLKFAPSTRESMMILLKKLPREFTGSFGDAHFFLRKSEKMIILSSGHISYFKEKVQPSSASATWLGVHWEMWWANREGIS